MSADSNLSSFVNIINISKFILETIKVKESFFRFNGKSIYAWCFSEITDKQFGKNK